MFAHWQSAAVAASETACCRVVTLTEGAVAHASASVERVRYCPLDSHLYTYIYICVLTRLRKHTQLHGDLQI